QTRVGEDTDAALPQLWAHTDPSYFQRFDATEIAWHAAVLQADTSPADAVVKVRAIDEEDANADIAYAVMVMTHDQPGLFARITGYFEKLSFDIAAARVYTTTHGYALDTFQILPKSAGGLRHKDLAATVERDLTRLLNNPSAAPASQSGRIARQVKHFPIEPAISLAPSRQKPYYELTVSCADRPGLLSSIARVFLSHDVYLHDARITTLGQRAEDVFIVANPKLGDTAFVRDFKSTLTQELRPQS
ncbi:MAG: bifunctional uridylyltransferase/uridylyl-removing protein, partial [Burkholderiales bacterium]|nr:bifunctional uridylyltransferase/uridylyl-removing protein [Burkholderiales bacterium]